jgi:proteasome accessory factor B
MAARKTERLLNLVICLLHTRAFLTAEQIRDLVPGYSDAPSDEAFKRMFERDKEDLRDLGIPLETGRNSVWDEVDGYRIARREYELPEVSLEPDEAAVVGLAARIWRTASLSESAARGLLKLRAAGIETDGPLPAGLEPRVEAHEESFAPLVEAVTDGRPVQFDYRPAGKTATTRRHVEPWGVVQWHGRWYLVGHDRDRDATRVFRLSRIAGTVAVVGESGSVTPPEGVGLVDAVKAYATEPAHAPARLRVRAGRGDDLRREAGRITPAEPGWDVLELGYLDVERLADRVLPYGADVVVLEPLDARHLVRRRLSALLAVAAG